MKLLFRQRIFSWFDSYDIYDEQGQVYFNVQGQLALGHVFYIYDKNQKKVGVVEQQIFRLLPHFNLYENEKYLGQIVKEFSFFLPRFYLDFNGWSIEGDWMQWEYTILDASHNLIATISKQIFHWTDTYVLDIQNEDNALKVLMIVLTIDAIKCSKK